MAKETEINLEQLLERVTAEKCRRSLYTFGKRFWPIVEPSEPYQENWHNGAIAEHLQACAQGEIKKLVINIPPGHCKSLWSSVFLHPWIWLNNPTFKGLFTSYASTLAEVQAYKARKIILSNEYKATSELCGSKIELDPNQNQIALYSNLFGGIRQTFGVGGGALGFRAHGVVCDDPLNVEDAFSKSARDACYRWWEYGISGRAVDPVSFWRVVVMQRLHSDDLSQHLIDQGYTHLCLPSEYNPKRSCVTVRKRGDVEIKWQDPRKASGELLFPDRYTAEVIAEFKKSPAYGAQHDQNPRTSGKVIIKREAWRFYRDPRWPGKCVRPAGCNDIPAIDLPDLDAQLISMDCSFKGKEDSDRVAIGCIAKAANMRFVRDVSAKQRDFLNTCQEFIRIINLWPDARKRLIEGTANGPAIISLFKTKISGLEERTPKASKIERAYMVQPEFDSGLWYLPEGAPWAGEVVSECADFPGGRYDDIVDMITQAGIEWQPTATLLRLERLIGISS